jgi:hypothetical protein
LCIEVFEQRINSLQIRGLLRHEVKACRIT